MIFRAALLPCEEVKHAPIVRTMIFYGLCSISYDKGNRQSFSMVTHNTLCFRYTLCITIVKFPQSRYCGTLKVRAHYTGINSVNVPADQHC